MLQYLGNNKKDDSTLEIIHQWEAAGKAAVEVGGIQPLQVWKYVYDPP